MEPKRLDLGEPFALAAAALLACAASGCAASPEPAPRRRDISSPDGLVRVPAKPPGEGWYCMVRRREDTGDARALSVVLCTVATPQGDLFVNLVDRELREAPPAPEKLCTDEYPARLRDKYLELHVVSVRPASHQGRPGCEVTLAATDMGGEPVRVVARSFLWGLHILRQAAWAPPELFEARRADIERWFAGASFTSLQRAADVGPSP
jgi:hypothetical protein